MRFLSGVKASLFLTLLVNAATVFAADQNITLRIHCWEGYSEPYIDDFRRYVQSTHGIDIDLQVSHSSDPKEFWELARAKKVDIICPVHSIFSGKWPFIKHNIVIPIRLNALTNYPNIRSELKNIVPSKTPGSLYGVPYAMGEYSLAYNADKVDPPTSWQVLWSQPAKNKYTVSRDYADANVYVAALAQGVSVLDIYSIDHLFEALTPTGLQNQLSSLAANAFSVWEGTADHTEFDQLHYAATWGYAVVLANKRGLNWKIAKVKERNTAWVDHWAITNAVMDQPNKRKLAEEWINFVISDEVQSHLAENWGITPVVELCGSRFAQPCSSAQASSATVSIWQQQSRRTTNGYALLWKTALSKRKNNPRADDNNALLQH